MSHFLNSIADQAKRGAIMFSCEEGSFHCQCGRCHICLHKTMLPVDKCNCIICVHKRSDQENVTSADGHWLEQNNAKLQQHNCGEDIDEKPKQPSTWQDRHTYKYVH
jgi:hypothetical protein